MGGENIIFFEKSDTLIFNEFCFKKHIKHVIKNDFEKGGFVPGGDLFRGGGGFDPTLQKQGGFIPWGDLFRGGFDPFPTLWVP